MLTYTENIMKNYNVHLLRDTVIHDKNLNIDINKLNITAGEVSSGYTVTKNNDLCDVAEVKIVTGRSELCLFNALRILYHEEEHARQAQLYKNPDGPASMAAMHAACMLDTNYYKHNYLSCLFEIDAEYYGLEKAVNIMTGMRGRKMAQELLDRFIESKINYYAKLRKGMHVDDIKFLFDKAYADALVSRRRDAVCDSSGFEQDIIKIKQRLDGRKFGDVILNMPVLEKYV